MYGTILSYLAAILCFCGLLTKPPKSNFDQEDRVGTHRRKASASPTVSHGFASALSPNMTVDDWD